MGSGGIPGPLHAGVQAQAAATGADQVRLPVVVHVQGASGGHSEKPGQSAAVGHVHPLGSVPTQVAQRLAVTGENVAVSVAIHVRDFRPAQTIQSDQRLAPERRQCSRGANVGRAHERRELQQLTHFQVFFRQLGSSALLHQLLVLPQRGRSLGAILQLDERASVSVERGRIVTHGVLAPGGQDALELGRTLSQDRSAEPREFPGCS